jgi:hypothetical protein
MNIKGIVGTFVLGAAMTIGCLAGTDAYNKLKDPCERAKIKSKFNKVKDALKKD